jgi:hypothetical protein
MNLVPVIERARKILAIRERKASDG